MTSALEAADTKLKGFIEEARGLTKKHKEGTLTAEESARAEALKGEIETVGAEIDRLKGTDANLSALGSIVSHLTGPVRKAAAAIGGADDEVQRRSLMREFADTDGYKRVAGTGMGSSGLFRAPDWAQRGDGPLLTGHVTPDALRTLVYGGATANLIPPDRLPGIYRGDPRENTIRDALASGRMNGTSVSYVRENVVTNAAAPIIEATTASPAGPSGAQYPESAITFTVESENAKSVGHMIPMTREILEDVALMETYIENRMIEMLNDKVDEQLIAGAGGNGLLGLQNRSGISVLDDTYFAANPLVSAGHPGENGDRLRRSKTYLRMVPRARATHVFINPFDLEDIEMERDDSGAYLYGGNGPSFQQKIGGMTIVENESVTAKFPITLDRRYFAVLDKLDLSVEVTDSNREWFEYRILALAVRTRLALLATRPAALAKVSLV